MSFSFKCNYSEECYQSSIFYRETRFTLKHSLCLLNKSFLLKNFHWIWRRWYIRYVTSITYKCLSPIPSLLLSSQAHLYILSFKKILPTNFWTEKFSKKVSSFLISHKNVLVKKTVRGCTTDTFFTSPLDSLAAACISFT